MTNLSVKLKVMYQLQDSLPKLIEDDFVPDQKLDDYYVKLKMSVKANSEKISINLEQIFSPVKENKAESRVLIVGGAGVGKSSLVVGYSNYDYLQNFIWADWKRGMLHNEHTRKPIIWV